MRVSIKLMEWINSSYSCYCIDGYTGINCEVNWDDCWSNPCLNGGTCNDAVAAYNCSCAEGFVGKFTNAFSIIFNDHTQIVHLWTINTFSGLNCEEVFSECLNQPCLNNGTCVDLDGFFMCQCQEGYSGKDNFKKFRKSKQNFFISLTKNFTTLGEYCEIDATVCNNTICKNGGECVEGPGYSFQCRCPEGLKTLLIVSH